MPHLNQEGIRDIQEENQGYMIIPYHIKLGVQKGKEFKLNDFLSKLRMQTTWQSFIALKTCGILLKELIQIQMKKLMLS